MKAISRNVRVSPFKLRLYADSVRGKNVGRAVNWLESQGVARVTPIAKTLVSAYHNAKQADASVTDMSQMRIREIRVDQGPVIKYFKPGAQGRACPQRKRLSHVSVIIEKY
jgi:large subunit ribosomal protein L22